nr:MAG: hypothetical protein [Bacteriophage sp.]
MSHENKTRNINHEMADALRLLDHDYTTTEVDCDPGDSAIRITKQNSEKTLYIIAYSDPDDTEMHVYDGSDSLTTCHVFSNGSLHDSTPEDIADYIIRSL